MRYKWWWVVLLAVVFLAVPASTVLAQGINGDKLVMGESFVLSSGERLSGNLTVIGGTATLEEESRVDGDVLVMGGSMTAAGTIDGDITVWGGHVTLDGTAVINGDLARFGGAIDRRPGAVISGRSVEGLGPGPFRVPVFPDSPVAPLPYRDGWEDGPIARIGSFLQWQLVTIGWALFLVLLGVVALLVAPQNIARIATTVGRDPLLSLGLGFLTLMVALLAGAVLLIACGLGLVVWLAAVLTSLVGWIAVGLRLGQRLLQVLRVRDQSSLLEVALGVLVITVLARLPCIGFLFGLAIGSIGIGAVLLTRFGTQPYESRRGPAPGDGPNSLGTGRGAADQPASSGAEEDFVPDPPGLHSGSGLVATQPEPSDREGADASGARSLITEDPAGGTPQGQDELLLIFGVSAQVAAKLRAAGVMSLGDVAASNPETLAQISGVDVDRVRQDDWIGQARQLLS